MSAVLVPTPREAPRVGTLTGPDVPGAGRPLEVPEGVPVPWGVRITASEAGARPRPRPTIAVRRQGDAVPSSPVAGGGRAGRAVAVVVRAPAVRASQVAAPTTGGPLVVGPEEVNALAPGPRIPVTAPAPVPVAKRSAREAARLPAVRIPVLPTEAVGAGVPVATTAPLTPSAMAPGVGGVAEATRIAAGPVPAVPGVPAAPSVEVEKAGIATTPAVPPAPVAMALPTVPRVRRLPTAPETGLPEAQAVAAPRGAPVALLGVARLLPARPETVGAAPRLLPRAAPTEGRRPPSAPPRPRPSRRRRVAGQTTAAQLRAGAGPVRPVVGAPQAVPQGALAALAASVGRQGATGPTRPFRPTMGRPLGARVVQVPSRDAVLGRRQGRRLGRLAGLDIGPAATGGAIP